jgi:hypothetical protein
MAAKKKRKGHRAAPKSKKRAGRPVKKKKARTKPPAADILDNTPPPFRPSQPPSMHWGNSFEAAAQIATWQQTRNVALLSTVGAVEPVPVPRPDDPAVGASDPNALHALDAGTMPQTIEAIQRALVARPLPIRDAARALAVALKAQAVELQHAKPNEPSKLEEYEGLIQFINETSDGLQALADTIDRAIGDTQQGSPEPVLLGKAAEIANQVHAGAMEWLLANRATVFEGAFRIGLFGLGMAFVSALGIELSPAVTASIATLAGTVGKGKPPDAK